jgi:hypothetical protein
MARPKARKRLVREGSPRPRLRATKPGAGAGFRARCGGERAGDPGAQPAAGLRRICMRMAPFALAAVAVVARPVAAPGSSELAQCRAW